jgi:anti-sigma factor RsiW
MTGHRHDRGRCRDLAARISEYIDEELPAALREEIGAHLHDCADCEKFVESLRRVRALGRLLPGPLLAPERLSELGERVRRRLEDAS